MKRDCCKGRASSKGFQKHTNKAVYVKNNTVLSSKPLVLAAIKLPQSVVRVPGT